MELGKAADLFGPCPFADHVAMEPSFWSWEKGFTLAEVLHDRGVAMEPSFWSWEKAGAALPADAINASRNGAQLLELGKAEGERPPGTHRRTVAMEPSFWSWEK